MVTSIFRLSLRCRRSKLLTVPVSSLVFPLTCLLVPRFEGPSNHSNLKLSQTLRVRRPVVSILSLGAVSVLAANNSLGGRPRRGQRAQRTQRAAEPAAPRQPQKTRQVRLPPARQSQALAQPEESGARPQGLQGGREQRGQGAQLLQPQEEPQEPGPAVTPQPQAPGRPAAQRRPPAGGSGERGAPAEEQERRAGGGRAESAPYCAGPPGEGGLREPRPGAGGEQERPPWVQQQRPGARLQRHQQEGSHHAGALESPQLGQDAVAGGDDVHGHLKVNLAEREEDARVRPPTPDHCATSSVAPTQLLESHPLATLTPTLSCACKTFLSLLPQIPLLASIRDVDLTAVCVQAAPCCTHCDKGFAGSEVNCSLKDFLPLLLHL